MNKFEAVLLFSPDLSNPQISTEDKNFEKNIKNFEGKVISIEDWGLRDISFKINKFKKSFYKFYQLEIKGSNIKDIKKIINSK